MSIRGIVSGRKPNGDVLGLLSSEDLRANLTKNYLYQGLLWDNSKQSIFDVRPNQYGGVDMDGFKCAIDDKRGSYYVCTFGNAHLDIDFNNTQYYRWDLIAAVQQDYDYDMSDDYSRVELEFIDGIASANPNKPNVPNYPNLPLAYVKVSPFSDSIIEVEKISVWTGPAGEVMSVPLVEDLPPVESVYENKEAEVRHEMEAAKRGIYQVIDGVWQQMDWSLHTASELRVVSYVPTGNANIVKVNSSVYEADKNRIDWVAPSLFWVNVLSVTPEGTINVPEGDAITATFDDIMDKTPSKITLHDKFGERPDFTLDIRWVRDNACEIIISDAFPLSGDWVLDFKNFKSTDGIFVKDDGRHMINRGVAEEKRIVSINMRGTNPITPTWISKTRFMNGSFFGQNSPTVGITGVSSIGWMEFSGKPATKDNELQEHALYFTNNNDDTVTMTRDFIINFVTNGTNCEGNVAQFWTYEINLGYGELPPVQDRIYFKPFPGAVPYKGLLTIPAGTVLPIKSGQIGFDIGCISDQYLTVPITHYPVITDSNNWGAMADYRGRSTVLHWKI